MVIGSLWLPAELRAGYKAAIHGLRDRHRVGGEFKWQKVSDSREAFYCELVEWFCGQGENLRFRCIAVDQQKIDLALFHDDDQELGFYKFYYQVLHHWIDDFNRYSVFVDFKSNRRRDRLVVLRQCLANANLTSQVRSVQAVRSEESILIQMADVLTGAVGAKLNGIGGSGSAKGRVVEVLERSLGRRMAATTRDEKKLNVFRIDLRGGW